MEYPLVSAIVLCYNHERFVVQCLEAIEQQEYPNLEILIHDDASRDNSVAVIQGWLAKTKLSHRLLRSDCNRGICRSMNNALAHARGKYVSGIAADDVWMPGKLLKQVAMMEQLPEKVGVVYGDALLMDEEGKDLGKKFIESDGRNRHFAEIPEGNIHLALWRDNFIAPMTTLVRRQCYERVGRFDENLFAEDWDMWLRISRHYDFAFFPQTAAKYRIVNSSATRSRFGELLDDMCRTCLKHLDSGELDSEARAEAIRKLQALASSSFRQKSPRHRENLLRASRFQPLSGTAARLLFACCGLNYDTFERMRLWLKSAA
jgi:glycosyltransferase involved in cell wall biosynthesis